MNRDGRVNDTVFARRVRRSLADRVGTSGGTIHYLPKLIYTGLSIHVLCVHGLHTSSTGSGHP